MANQEHLNKLREGAAAWNQWRKEHTDILHPDLHDARLRGASLNGADLSYAHLISADLIGADLSYAHLIGADLSYAHLSYADLSHAHLSYADLSHAHLMSANISSADLNSADLSTATCWDTIFANVDLQTVTGLESVKHDGPSTIGIDTIYLSQGKIPEVFLKGAGIDDTFITYIHSLTNIPIQYYSCFISYSSTDDLLAHRLHADLQGHGVRCWFAPEDMKIGDTIRSRIDEAIHLQDKLLLLLSEHSIASSWVEVEVEAAFEKEQRQQREMLFPIRLDASVMQTSQAWAAKLRRTRHIGDFTSWKEPNEYQKALIRLLRDLKAQP